MTTSLSPAVSSFVDTLYAASDVGPSAHQAYVDLYLPDATLIMGPTTYSGHDGIRRVREGGWEKVASRRHVCKGIFPSPDRPERECMTYGTVDYGFKDGTSKEGVEFAARLVLEYVEGLPKIKFYQVYIVSAGDSNACRQQLLTDRRRSECRSQFQPVDASADHSDAMMDAL
jgi:hypothetical protein